MKRVRGFKKDKKGGIDPHLLGDFRKNGRKCQRKLFSRKESRGEGFSGFPERKDCPAIILTRKEAELAPAGLKEL